MTLPRDILRPSSAGRVRAPRKPRRDIDASRDGRRTVEWYGLAEAYLDWISGRRRQGVELGGLTSPHPALPV